MGVVSFGENGVAQVRESGVNRDSQLQADKELAAILKDWIKAVETKSTSLESNTTSGKGTKL